MKTLLLSAAVLVLVACGDTTAPNATETVTTPSAQAAATLTPPASAQTVVTFVNAPISAPRGLHATLQVRTSANTACSIEVDYKSGPSKAAGLGPTTSDAAGNVSWTWIVGGNTTPGSWPIIVTWETLRHRRRSL